MDQSITHRVRRENAPSILPIGLFIGLTILCFLAPEAPRYAERLILPALGSWILWGVVLCGGFTSLALLLDPE